MKKYLLLILLLLNISVFAQNTNVYDFAPSAKVTTNGTINNGGATARSFSSFTILGTGQYIIFDLGASLSISTITFGTFWSSDGRYIPNGYTIDYSNDGINYTNVVTNTGNQNIAPVHNISSPSERYWRFTITAVQSGQTACNIAGFQLLGAGIGAATNNLFWGGGGFNNTSINYMAGNVGIGTTNPVANLHIGPEVGGGGNNPTMLISTLAGTKPSILFTEYTARSAAIGISSDNYLALGSENNHTYGIKFQVNGNYSIGDLNSGTTAMLINNGGNVLIGKTSQANSTYILDVAGNVRANKLIVNTTGADFVFAKKYHLISLDELEKYIHQNKHLPGIESAKEMSKEGVDVGNNETKLLQKMEELTLYLIEQNKKIDALSRENLQLKQRIEKIVNR